VFVSFEGIGGAGKTTQARLLGEWLRSLGFETEETREPGGTPAGEEIRELLLDVDTELAPRAEAALFAASRAQLVEAVILPALARGAAVVCDRYVDSSLVYQGEVEGIGHDAVLELNAFATADLMPDVTFVLLVDPGVAHARRHAHDRIEPNDDRRLQLLHEAYLQLANAFQERIVLIDGSGNVADVSEKIRRVAIERLREVRERLRDRS